jgi:alpha-beta hydrolase superfamily lysophospholipase
MPSRPRLVFVHGLYMNSRSWAPWIARAEAAGFAATAATWPAHEGDPSALRASAPEGLTRLRFDDVVGAVRAHVGGLDEPPVLVGHSIGGLIVLRLLAEGIGRAGVAIAPAPPRGRAVWTPRFLLANLPHSYAFALGVPLRMSRRRFRATFGNASPREESDRLWEQWCVPESRGIPLSTLGPQGAVDLAAIRAPVLLYGAALDRLTPDRMVRGLADACGRAGVDVQYHSLAGRSHLVCGQQGWERLEDEILAWASARTLTGTRGAG